MPETPSVGTSGGTKEPFEFHLGTSGGTKRLTELHVGVAGVAKRFFSHALAAPSGLAANALDSDTIRLTHNGDSEEVESYKVYWRKGASMAGNKANADGSFSVALLTTYDHEPLDDGATYYYAICAVRYSEESALSAEVSDTTDEVIPTAPSILATSPVGGEARITITDNSDNEDTFYVYRSTTDGFTPGVGNRIATLSRTAGEKVATGGTVVYDDDDPALVEGTIYYYRVGAANSAGEAYSLQDGVTISYTAPGVPDWAATYPKDVSGDDDGIDLKLVPSTGSGTITYHVYYRVGASMGGNPTAYSYLGGFTEAEIASAAYTHATGQAHGTVIYYQARAENPGGYSGWNTEASATVQARVPGIPTIGTPSRVGANATIPWTQTSPDNETLYRLEEEYRSDPGDPFGGTVTFTNAANDTDASRTLVDGREYRWRVRAENAAGNSDYSAWSDALRYTETPGTPGTVALDYDGTNPASELVLSWASGGGTVDGYDIEIVAYSGSFTGTPTHTAGAGETSKRLTTLSDDTRHKARIRATNVWSEASSWSGEVDEWTAPATPGACVWDTGWPKATGDDTLELQISNSPYPADADELEFYGGGALLTTQAGVTYSWTGRAANTQYTGLKVRAKKNPSVGSPHSAAFGSYTTEVSRYTWVDVPQSFTAVRDSGACPLNEFDLSWSNNNGDAVARSETMTVERDDGSGYAVLSSAVTAGATTYNDTGATATTVGYRVKYNSESTYASDTSLGPACPE